MPALDAVLTQPFCKHQIEFHLAAADPASRPSAAQTVSVSLKNIGEAACEMFALPAVSFKDASGRTLPITNRLHYDYDDLKRGKQRPSGTFGRGFPLPLIIIPAGATATGKITWNADFTGRHCFDARSISYDYSQAEGVDMLNGNNVAWPSKVCGRTSRWSVYSTENLRVSPSD